MNVNKWSGLPNDEDNGSSVEQHEAKHVHVRVQGNLALSTDVATAADATTTDTSSRYEVKVLRYHPLPAVLAKEEALLDTLVPPRLL